MEFHTPVIRRSKPTVTADGYGNVRGTGRFRAYFSVAVRRSPQSFALGPVLSWTKNGFIPELRKQGWRSQTYTLHLFVWAVRVHFKFHDDPVRGVR